MLQETWRWRTLGSSARLLYMRHAKVVKVRNPLWACVLQVALTVWHICWFSFCASRRVLATYISIATCTHDMHCMIKPCPVCRNSGLKLKALGAHNTPWIINGCNNFSWPPLMRSGPTGTVVACFGTCTLARADVTNGFCASQTSLIPRAKRRCHATTKCRRCYLIASVAPLVSFASQSTLACVMYIFLCFHFGVFSYLTCFGVNNDKPQE